MLVYSEYLNYIKQLRLKDHFHLSRGFFRFEGDSMYFEYDILLARVDHGEGPHVFYLFLSSDPKHKGEFCGLNKHNFSAWDLTGEAVQGNL